MGTFQLMNIGSIVLLFTYLAHWSKRKSKLVLLTSISEWKKIFWANEYMNEYNEHLQIDRRGNVKNHSIVLVSLSDLITTL